MGKGGEKGGDKVGEKGGRFVADNFHQRRCCAGTVAYCKEGNFIVKAYKAFNDNLSASCASAFLLVLIFFGGDWTASVCVMYLCHMCRTVAFTVYVSLFLGTRRRWLCHLA